jgi:hypothetical protein
MSNLFILIYSGGWGGMKFMKPFNGGEQAVEVLEPLI